MAANDSLRNHASEDAVRRVGSLVFILSLGILAPSCTISIGGGGGHETHFLGTLFVAGIGMLLFYGGFQKFRKFRLLEDTPLMPIRSIPMGLVHVRGQAAGTEHVTSPITHVPCYYYQVLVEKWLKDQRGEGRWSMCLRHTDHVKFNLQDATGKVLIDPHWAELEMPETFLAELRPHALGERTIDPNLPVGSGPSDSELLEYLAQTNTKIHAESALHQASRLPAVMDMERNVSFLPSGSSSTGTDLATEPLRFKETCILPDREYNIMGTCVENPTPKDAYDRNMILRGQNERTFLISWKTEQALETDTRKGSLTLILIGGALLIGAAALFLHDIGVL